MMKSALVLAAGLALGGCATLDQFGSVDTQNVTDAQGNVAGFKQMLRNKDTGEVVAQVKLFTPLRNERGELVGYEEQTQDGAIIRSLDGRRVGTRFSDLRSRNTNKSGKGVAVILGSLDARRVVASLSEADLKAIR